MIAPNYKKHSVREMKDILDNIDHEKWPDLVKEIEEIINNPDKNKKRLAAIDKKK